MNLFRLFSNRKASLDERLIGRWRIVKATGDHQSADETVAEFGRDGSLTYSVTENGKTGITRMTYHVEDGVIVSDQPSRPKKERTEYRFEGDKRLVLMFDGERTDFDRV